MDFRYKTIVTNGLQLAVKLSKKNDVKIIFLGGVIQPSSLSTNGSFASSMLERFRIDLMLSSCASIRLDGTYETTPETMQIKHDAFLRSDKHILLADKNKFGYSYPYRTQKLGDYDAIYTNADDSLLRPFREQGLTNIVNKEIPCSFPFVSARFFYKIRNPLVSMNGMCGKETFRIVEC